MPSSNPERRFRDILENIERIEQYTLNVNEEEFGRRRMTQDAVERCLSRISEAAVKLDSVAEALCPEQPWFKIRGIGNHLRHGYDSLDSEILWKTVSDHLPPLKSACESALRKLAKRR